ncbi:uncharacterized protein E0L32_005632 [Thyridium curvatum]|uniref:LYC1 C-terminal domain-containing protein n=1 Tax=Thyridium curvatum TaxID=1093900 RepID=A0A507AVD5_9PEZI|nr:uncharacterized protein E0L32_005632 [Thyridium curvatum]TPX13932.1 hypothetical protein E0L32_005632 [Thyridium curvatum]
MAERHPSITPADIVFAEATPRQQKLAWELNGASWAKPMSIAEYVDREAHLSRQDLAAGGGCRYWVVFPRDRPDEIVAGCESTRKTLLVRRAGLPGEVYQVSAYAIASVYTNPEYRRLGMASLMLRRLQEAMDLDSEGSALYSDIGKVYYAQLGWDVFPSDQATLEILDREEAARGVVQQQQQQQQQQKTRYLSKDELPALCERDVADLKERLAGLPDDGKTHIAFSPTWSQVAWHFAREEFMARAMFSRAIERRGAATEDGRSWAIWDHDFREKKLKVQRIVTTRPESEERRVEDVAALLQAAVAEAAAWDLPKVLLWNPDEAFTLGAKGVGNAMEGSVKVIFDERLDGSIPCFRWKGGKDTSATVWEDNYYYCWC